MEIVDDLEAIGLHATARALDELVLEATRKKLSYVDFLASMLKLELADRATKRETMLMRLARFPQVKTLESFDFTHLPDLDPKVVAELCSLRFVKNHENLLLLGPPGIGKSHLAVAIGVEAARSGHKVYFTTLEEMIKRLSRTSSSPKSLRVYVGCSLLIIDEVGYLPMGPAEAHLFFQVISARYERGSVIITSNKGVGEWGEYLSDVTLAAALLDRFLHHCHVLNLKGDSFRLKDKVKGSKAKGKGVEKG
ncbi:MAG: ATP-binding protein [Actinobacteria bacterium]|nr:ATP-binding protein [Actinomycetota bacterium]